jgi:hypothetical protein
MDNDTKYEQPNADKTLGRRKAEVQAYAATTN